MRLVTSIAILVVLSGCASNEAVLERSSELTQGTVQMHLVSGQTTKAEVLEVFGAPNVTTRDGSGREVWSYQRQAQVSRSSSRSGFWTILLGGGGSSSSGFETSSRMITLIIKFNADDFVTDFRSRASNF